MATQFPEEKPGEEQPLFRLKYTAYSSFSQEVEVDSYQELKEEEERIYDETDLSEFEFDSHSCSWVPLNEAARQLLWQVRKEEQGETVIPAPTPEIDANYLIDYDQDMFYEVRDTCRRLIARQIAFPKLLARWMKKHYDARMRGHLGRALTEEEWLTLAESCLEDTQEIVEYEKATFLLEEGQEIGKEEDLTQNELPAHVLSLIERVVRDQEAELAQTTSEQAMAKLLSLVRTPEESEELSDQQFADMSEISFVAEWIARQFQPQTRVQSFKTWLRTQSLESRQLIIDELVATCLRTLDTEF